MRTRRPFLSLLSLLVGATPLLSACAGDASATELKSDKAREVVSLADAPAVPAVVAATDKLGLQLLGLTEKGKNAVTSPVSAAIALAMVGEGAQGTTAKELDAVLGATGTARSRAVNALSADLARFAGSLDPVREGTLPDKPLVHVANNVVVDDNAKILTAYLDLLSTSYGAGVSTADLGSEAGKRVLDAWVDDNTGGLIKQSAIQPDPFLRLVLQNAVVLAARWETPFAASATHAAPFTLADGSRVEVSTMSSSVPLRYAEVSGWKAVRMPYRDGDLYADVLLPPAGTSPSSLDADLLQRLTKALDVRANEPVALTLPKVDLSMKTNLLPLLDAATPTLVDPDRADLSGISTAERLSISQAWQQVTFKVDEEGTVAAAVTELAARTSSAPIAPALAMRVDHPYVVRLAPKSTGVTLFLARIMDPRG